MKNVLVEIPKNATNGKVFSMIYPYMDVDFPREDIVVITLDNTINICVTLNWWNTPYDRNVIEIPSISTNGVLLTTVFSTTEVRNETEHSMEFTLDRVIGVSTNTKWWNEKYMYVK